MPWVGERIVRILIAVGQVNLLAPDNTGIRATAGVGADARTQSGRHGTVVAKLLDVVRPPLDTR